GHHKMHGAGKARYHIYGEMVLDVYIAVPHTQIIPNTEKALQHGNLEPVWPKTYIVGNPFNVSGHSFCVRVYFMYKDRLE
ncbi:hypothetical protein C0991_000978, partial [Blastosporella zonata]